MKVITARNVHEALWRGMHALVDEGVERPSRAGKVVMYPGPVTTHYLRPRERVIFWHERDANPFFHLMECLWMLSGRDDVEWLAQYNSRIAQFSDDGEKFHGAYGFRWRNHFAIDQLETLVTELQANNDTRRAVLSMWDASEDLGAQSVDIPCNLNIVFSRRRDPKELDMTVFNRSNDIIWGAYGANAVHFSFLQEVLATMLGIHVGQYWQVSNDYHAYLDVFYKNLDVWGYWNPNVANPYVVPGKRLYSQHPYDVEERVLVVEPYPIIHGIHQVDAWWDDLTIFMDEGAVMGMKTQFFRRVAVPVALAWNCYKENDLEQALVELQQCHATDWCVACMEWILRREPRGV